MEDDLTLLREYAANRSEAAFETLVSRYTGFVYSAALRQTRDPHQAEEVTQAVFIILAQKAGRIGSDRVLSGWLFKTTRFVALAQSRARMRRFQYEQKSHMHSADQSDSPDPLWEQISPLLDEALAHLGEKDRQAVLLRYFENKNLTEVGTFLGTKEDAARMRVNRALGKLHRFFGRRGISSTAVVLAGMLSARSVHAAPAALTKTAAAAALGKSATATASTSTLIKGTLKLMAWTKAKTTAVAAVAVLLTAGTSVGVFDVVHVLRAAHYPDIQGAWEGTMLLDDDGVAAGDAARTRVVLYLTKSNGVYLATTDWIERGRKNVPLGKVVYDYPSLHIGIARNLSWNLMVNGDATQMMLDHAIHFSVSDPVLLKRTTTPDAVPERLTENDFAPRPGSPLQGYWKGEIGTGPDALPVDLKITALPDGTFRAEGDNPMQGENGQPVTITHTRLDVKLMRASGAGMFEGKMNDTGTEMTGAWIQNGASTPATLRRADYHAEHAHDADKDYSFASENDLQGHWKGTWALLFGNVNVKIRFALDIARLPDGSYSAALANLDEFGKDDFTPASTFEYSPPDLQMKWKWSGDTSYEGKLQHGKIVGTWFQSGGGFPLVFERAGQNDPQSAAK